MATRLYIQSGLTLPCLQTQLRFTTTTQNLTKSSSRSDTEAELIPIASISLKSPFGYEQTPNDSKVTSVKISLLLPLFVVLSFVFTTFIVPSSSLLIFSAFIRCLLSVFESSSGAAGMLVCSSFLLLSFPMVKFFDQFETNGFTCLRRGVRTSPETRLCDVLKSEVRQKRAFRCY